MQQIFCHEEVEKLRRRVAKVAKLPAKVPDGWSISTVDPMAVLAVFTPLCLKPGFVLRAYQYQVCGNGNGFVWAVPADSEFPAPENCPRLRDAFLEPPKPPLALDHVMDAIDGDGSPWSYQFDAERTEIATGGCGLIF